MSEKLQVGGENVIDRLFGYDKDFPAVKIGKKYLVEAGAFKSYLSKRRTNKQD